MWYDFTQPEDYTPAPSPRQLAWLDFHDACRQRLWDCREELKTHCREAPVECFMLALCGLLFVAIVVTVVWVCV